MEWPEIDFESNFWLGVAIAAACATALSTAMAVAVSLWWRLVDARGPAWVVYDEVARWEAAKTAKTSRLYPHATCTVANAGPAAAYAVRFRGVGCWVSEASLIPAMVRGASVDLVIGCEVDLWDRAELVVVWTQPRAMFRGSKSRVHSWRLAELAEQPEFVVWHTDGRGKEITIPVGVHGLPEDLEPPPPQHPLPTGGRLRRRRQRRQIRRGR